jgi:hypothetical protein
MPVHPRLRQSGTAMASGGNGTARPPADFGNLEETENGQRDQVSLTIKAE